ncbi:hypothetical protein [Crocinitomix algicola]|uniref:hypothetical protein n=1 Tax=Crocinitomix algicola TaxID=1740263 RepID=UPI00087252E8|nr:hypothetical protein [Crocinitomix algicola]
MKYLIILLSVLTLVACKNEKALEITPEQIDNYVNEKSSETQEYDVSQSLRFSREQDTYEVVEFLQNDSVILNQEIIQNELEHVTRQVFYKSGLPVFINEVIARNSVTNPFEERKIYLDGVSIIEAHHRTAEYEQDLPYIDYQAWEANIENYDFQRPKDAILQKGEFSMSFSEFIEMDPQKYLILENEKSKYDVALFVAENHELIQKLELSPEDFKGQKIFVTHQFVLMNNIERMLFVDGELK